MKFQQRTATALAMLAMAAWFGWTPPAAARSSCPAGTPAPSVSVRIQPGKVIVNNRYGQRNLKRLHGQGSKLRGKSGWNPVGLTSTELGFSMKVRINALPLANGRYCGYLDTVNASFGYDQLTVYIDSKYRPGSCQHASIMEHEKLHVLVFRRTLEKYAPRVERRLARASARMQPVVASNAKQAATRLKNKLRNEIQPLFREMNRQLNRSNAKLDTPENYKREQKRCAEW